MHVLIGPIIEHAGHSLRGARHVVALGLHQRSQTAVTDGAQIPVTSNIKIVRAHPMSLKNADIVDAAAGCHGVPHVVLCP